MRAAKPNNRQAFRQFIAERRKQTQNDQNDNDNIEIHVSPIKSPQKDRKSLASPIKFPTKTEMVTIYTACGHKFIVPKEVACLSG